MLIEIAAPAMLPLGLVRVEHDSQLKTCLLGLTVQHPPVTVRAEQETAPAECGVPVVVARIVQKLPDLLARRHDPVVAVGRNARCFDARSYRGGAARTVGQDDEAVTALA